MLQYAQNKGCPSHLLRKLRVYTERVQGTSTILSAVYKIAASKHVRDHNFQESMRSPASPMHSRGSEGSITHLSLFLVFVNRVKYPIGNRSIRADAKFERALEDRRAQAGDARLRVLFHAVWTSKGRRRVRRVHSSKRAGGAQARAPKVETRAGGLARAGVEPGSESGKLQKSVAKERRCETRRGEADRRRRGRRGALERKKDADF